MPTSQEAKTEKPRPVYIAEKMDGELPEDVTLPRTGPRMAPELREALLVAQSDPNEWYCVGKYRSENGAKTTQKRFQRHELELPKGEWELETRRVRAEDGITRWSNLYAKFLG
jgi:hypothetical protein